MRISKFSIRRPVFTLVTMVLVIILGGVSLLNIPLKLIPDLNPPVGVVVANYPGANPQEVVEEVSKPLEDQLSTLPGLKRITSTSQEGASLTVMEFSWSTTIDDVETDIQSRVDQTNLPDDVKNPRFMKFDPSQFPIIQLSLTAGNNSDELDDLAEELEQELTKVEGVASVDMSGITVKEVKVLLDQDEMTKYGLTQDDVKDVIQANDVSMPGDTVKNGSKELTTRVLSALDSVDTLKSLNVAVNPANGEKVKLQDISTVKVEPVESDVLTRTNQEPSVLLSVLQQTDANTAEVSEAFQDRLDELLEKEKYEEVEAAVLFDQGDFVEQAIGSMANALILGGLFAMIILFLFLRSVKSPIIIGVAIPYSVIVTFVLMYFADFTLNIMTLGGLALGIGMLVDNAIVVIENIYRHLSMGKDPKTAASDGAAEVGGAITASTLTTVAVFLPVVFITGIIGNLFKEFALTIAFSLFASLVVALTVVPMLASRWLKAPKENIEENRQKSTFMTSLDSAIKWALKHRVIVLLVTFLLLLGGGYGVYTVGTQFLPTVDEGFFTITVTEENGTSLEETDNTISAIENILDGKEEISEYVSLVGTTQNDSFSGTGSSSKAEIYVKMVDIDKRELSTAEYADELERDVKNAAGDAEVNFNLQSSTGTSPNTLVFHVRDTDEERLTNTVTDLTDSIREIDGVKEVSNDEVDTVEEVQITIDKDKAFDNGLAPAQVAMVVNNVTRGTTASRMEMGGNEILDVTVSYPPDVTESTDNLKDIQIKKSDGSYIALDEVAEIETGTGPVSINRIDQEKAVQFNVKYTADSSLGDISAQVDEKIEELDLPEETEITYTGDRELMESSIQDLGKAFLLAIILVYLVMAAQFESLKYPFVIMFTVPLIVIGVSIGLTATRTPVGVTVAIGLIVLAGIVVNNAIVIVDYINQKKRDGLKTYDAIVISVKDRTRPVLMTALTTILGLIPLAIGLGEGTEMQQPMGITVIGGLISSTFLTLFVIPVVYSYFDKQTRRMNKKYVTPDGQLIPAYLLDEREDKADKGELARQDEDMNNYPVSDRTYTREEMVDMLEDLVYSLKRGRRHGNDQDEDRDE
ncbi:efflux RND transporter permease subunit [Bacillus marinisedimentorum]|uniref:efflux RND transporter permease subunit n=1 Tax=Bacillus marinisedimentorum TaxID=1821260 RepID=UPI0009F62CF9|nr:efflux RND transporter permease subunit [Bacillus marinisedimentorum]